MDYALARQNMVKSQLRTNQVTDPRILAAMADLPRELFVAANQQPLAYVDEDIPLKFGQAVRYFMEPRVGARLIQAARIKPDDLVLEVGCLTGYYACVLAQLAGGVYALDSNQYALNKAKELASQLKAYNIKFIRAEHGSGYAAKAPFDVILVSGAVPVVPQTLTTQLAEGGRLVTVLDEHDDGQDGSGMGKAMLYEKHGGHVSGRPLFDAQIKPLPGIEKKKKAFAL